MGVAGARGAGTCPDPAAAGPSVTPDCPGYVAITPRRCLIHVTVTRKAGSVPDRTHRRVPLRLTDVTIEDDFWAPRRELVRTATLRQQERQLRTGGQFEALRLGWMPGDAKEPHIFWESDVAKWIEAASYCLARTPDPELEASVDEAIELLAGAQQEDGYLNVYFTVVKPGERFTDLRDAHELYCAGHLIEAGVAHFEATGKKTLLDVVTRFADLIDREFGPGGRCEGGYDGHEEVELALVKLARATGQRRYLDLAMRMVQARGQQPFYFEQEEQRRGTPGYFGGVFPFTSVASSRCGSVSTTRATFRWPSTTRSSATPSGPCTCTAPSRTSARSMATTIFAPPAAGCGPA
jgi:hypothetical protein